MMNKGILMLIILIIHMIGAIITIFIHCKDGTLKQAAKHGDGIRYAKPSDVIVQDLIMWEFLLMFSMLDYAGNEINNYFDEE